MTLSVHTATELFLVCFASLFKVKLFSRRKEKCSSFRRWKCDKSTNHVSPHNGLTMPPKRHSHQIILPSKQNG